MPEFEIAADITTTVWITVDADSKEQAKGKFMRGEYDDEIERLQMKEVIERFVIDIRGADDPE